MCYIINLINDLPLKFTVERKSWVWNAFTVGLLNYGKSWFRKLKWKKREEVFVFDNTFNVSNL